VRVNNSGSAGDGVTDYRPITDEDVKAIRYLNNDAYPAVPKATTEELHELIGKASWGMAAWRDGEIAGFIFCFSPGADYDSENYRYFESHYDSHFYIDRIVVAKAHRGSGLGVTLYNKVFAEAKKRGFGFVTCEVNLDPPNPVSIAFHHRMGFEDVGEQETKSGTVYVQLMAANMEPVGA
jgi:predicted GNAT superfamily acetyltransferase